jgi:hypothetical protein
MPERLDIEALLERAAAAVDTSGGERVLGALAANLAGVAVVVHPPRRPLTARRPVAIAVAVLVVVAAVLVASPATRAAVARLLGLGRVEIIRVDALPPAVAATLPDLDLGAPTTLAAAAPRLGYQPLDMGGSGLGPPDAVYLDGSAMSYVYRPRPGLPETEIAGVGLLLTQLEGHTGVGVIKKVVEPGTTYEAVSVGGRPGVWVEGEPHAVAYVGPDEEFVEVPVRLAGNVLVWQLGDVTVRLEADLSRADAIALAAAISR